MTTTNAASAENTMLRSISFVTSRHMVRPVNAAHKAAVKAKIERIGFLAQHPLCVTAEGKLWAGNHRYEVALELGLSEVPMFIAPEPESLDRAAIEDNDASADALPNTFVDIAELVWRKLDAGQTQQAVADELGKSRDAIAKFAAMKAISVSAWDVVTTAVRSVTTSGEDGVTANVTDGTFSENLLRSILALTPAQQLDLVTRLAAGHIKKSQFKTQAENLKSRNEATDWVRKELSAVDADILDGALAEVAKGIYDDEWKAASGSGARLGKLVEAKRDAHKKLHAITLIRGDFAQEIEKLPSGSIDAIITDPPYNISQDRTYTRTDGANIEKNFGAWDNVDHAEFKGMISAWAASFARVLKPGGTGFMFVGERYFNVAQDIFEAAGFEIKGTFFWCRTNPGASMTQADFMPAMDYAIQFVKPGAKRTFNYPGDADGDGFNWRRFPICGGGERIKRQGARADESASLHPTQKPEAVIRHLMECVTVPGDTVLDGFMGVGTTAAVAKKSGRRFIGFEIDQTFFDAAKQRLA